MGSVSPLIAIAKEFQKKREDATAVFVGTANGPEKHAIGQAGFRFVPIIAGKLRRYFSIKNGIDIVFILIGCVQAWILLGHERPDAIMTAGSFVSVPVAWAGWIRRIPVFVHQQDVRKGLDNSLMEKIATKITVTFDVSLKDFQNNKTTLTGNPVQRGFMQAPATKALEIFPINPAFKTLLIVGGGTGARALNDIAVALVEPLQNVCQVIHIMGTGKGTESRTEWYQSYEFLTADAMALAYSLSDIVLCRSGIATLTELSYLGKPAIIIPMPDSHQEDNAGYVWHKKAGIVLDQTTLDIKKLAGIIIDLCHNAEKRLQLSTAITSLNPRDAAEKVVLEVEKII